MQLFVFTRHQDRLLRVLNGYVFFAADWTEFPTHRFSFFESSQIYLFDRILATVCSVRKQIPVFKLLNRTKFVFHNHIQTNDKVQPLPFAKN